MFLWCPGERNHPRLAELGLVEPIKMFSPLELVPHRAALCPKDSFPLTGEVWLKKFMLAISSE